MARIKRHLNGIYRAACQEYATAAQREISAAGTRYISKLGKNAHDRHLAPYALPDQPEGVEKEIQQLRSAPTIIISPVEQSCSWGVPALYPLYYRDVEITWRLAQRDARREFGDERGYYLPSRFGKAGDVRILCAVVGGVAEDHHLSIDVRNTLCRIITMCWMYIAAPIVIVAHCLL